MDPASLRPARRNQPDPEEGWSAADLTDEDRVDDDFIVETIRRKGRVYPPLMPKDEKLFPVHDQGGILQPGLTTVVNDSDEAEEVRRDG